MKEGREITDTGQPLDIYDAKLTFRKNRQGLKVVRVVVRLTKKGRRIEKSFPFTEDIYDNDHSYWGRYMGKPISVYLRRDKHKYVNTKKRLIIPMDLGQRLEKLVRETYFKNSVQTNIEES